MMVAETVVIPVTPAELIVAIGNYFNIRVRFSSHQAFVCKVSMIFLLLWFIVGQFVALLGAGISSIALSYEAYEPLRFVVATRFCLQNINELGQQIQRHLNISSRPSINQLIRLLNERPYLARSVRLIIEEYLINKLDAKEVESY